jgi:hypothetical protein
MKCRVSGAVLASLVLTSAVAIAQQAPAAAGFVYNMKMGAGQGSGAMDLSMGFTIKSAEPDGTRKATLTVKAPKMPPLNGKQVDATISPAGAIEIGSTGDIPKHYSPADAKALSVAATGPMLQMMINPLNAFAKGCGLAPSQNAGTSWHAFSNEAQSDVVYTITGREQRSGRDTIVVTMKSASSAGPSLTGQGDYDPAAHLVVTVHAEFKQSAQATMGQVLDVEMAQP